MRLSKSIIVALILVLGTATAGFAQAAASANIDPNAACALLPSHNDLQAALTWARMQSNGGFNLDMWGTVVNRDGIVCAVAFTGANRGSQWPGSRAISAQKANTANAFSLPGLALSTADLFSAVQPGGSLYGLQASNPVDTSVAYGGNPANYGQFNDPMTGGRIGGVNVFGGGLALYNKQGVLIGAIGVSGDSSCADHNIAWRTRNRLKLDYVPAGVGPDATRPDNIVYDITQASGVMIGVSASGWGHPVCSAAATSISLTLPAVRIKGSN
ncbi:MAG TPA: heme-binding protein [Terracidiphilus sp.]|nr:heme-binding protein [Terracidiphilus sp.]